MTVIVFLFSVIVNTVIFAIWGVSFLQFATPFDITASALSIFVWGAAPAALMFYSEKYFRTNHIAIATLALSLGPLLMLAIIFSLYYEYPASVINRVFEFTSFPLPIISIVVLKISRSRKTELWHMWMSSLRVICIIEFIAIPVLTTSNSGYVGEYLNVEFQRPIAGCAHPFLLWRGEKAVCCSTVLGTIHIEIPTKHLLRRT